MTQLLETTLAFLRAHGMEIEADMMERQHQLQTAVDEFDAAFLGTGTFPEIATAVEAPPWHWPTQRPPSRLRERSAYDMRDEQADRDLEELKLERAERYDREDGMEPW